MTNNRETLPVSERAREAAEIAFDDVLGVRTLADAAAIDANEMHGGCHTVCAPLSAVEARDNLARLALGRNVVCRQTGTSYRRIVAECRVDGVDLGCAQLCGGFAVDWPRYDPHGAYARACERR